MKLFEVARDIHRNLTRKVGYECGKAGRDYRCPLAVRYRPLRNRGKSRGGTIIRFTRRHESDSFWEWCRLQTLMIFRWAI